jgi:glycosyltransferase involved in cell wall biosynthesis
VFNKLAKFISPQGNIEPLLSTITEIRSESDTLALCPSATGINWLGINHSTLASFPTNTLELPQYYSNSLLSPQLLKQLTNAIARKEFKNIIFSGFPPYFEQLINQLRPQTKAKLGCIFHGTLSELGNSDNQLAMLPFQLTQSGKLDKIGLIRKDLVKPLSELFSINCFELRNVCIIPEHFELLRLNKEKIHIGIFGGNTFNKNLHNQVAGALLVNNSVIHVGNLSSFRYWNQANRIIEHGTALNRSEFLRILASMDLNMYLSFSESFGQVALESLAVGVPSLVSSTSNILNDSPSLDKHLSVSDVDKPQVIADKIETILANRTSIVNEGLRFVLTSNSRAQQLISEFLQA